MSQPIEDALNECIDCLLNGEGLEECLAKYPDLAEELRPLLATASAVIAATSLEPRPGFVAETRYQINSTMDKQRPSRSLSTWRWAAVAAIAMVLLASSAAIPAAAEALPDEPLYAIKRARERIELLLPQDEATVTEKHITIVQRRLDELEIMQQQRRLVNAPLVIDIADETERVATLLERQAQPAEMIARRFIQATSRQQTVLEKIAKAAPPESTEAFEKALERTERWKEQAAKLLEKAGQNGPGTPPGNPGHPLYNGDNFPVASPTFRSR